MGSGLLAVLLRCGRASLVTEHMKCPRCGSENLALMRTLDLKYCVCGQWMSWKLKVGQKPVGYGVDPEQVSPCTGDSNDHVRADVRSEE